jgi:hypothetical protein
MQTLKGLALFLAASLCAIAQTNPLPICQQANCYTASTGSVSLSGAATAATIQQPAVPSQIIYGVKASIQCSVACVVTRTSNPTSVGAATTTAGTIVQSPARPLGAVAPTTLFFTASNQSGGTVIDVTNVAAGSEQLFDLSDVVIGAAPSAGYTISVGSITGTANITFYLVLAAIL